MHFELELPRTQGDALTAEAEKFGLSVDEHVSLVLMFASALLDGESGSPLRGALNTFFEGRSLDAEKISAAMKDLVRIAATVHDRGKGTAEFPPMYRPATSDHSGLLALISKIGGSFTPDDRSRRVSAFGKYAHLPGGSEEFAREKQQEIAREEAKFR